MIPTSYAITIKDACNEIAEMKQLAKERLIAKERQRKENDKHSDEARAMIENRLREEKQAKAEYVDVAKNKEDIFLMRNTDGLDRVLPRELINREFKSKILFVTRYDIPDPDTQPENENNDGARISHSTIANENYIKVYAIYDNRGNVTLKYNEYQCSEWVNTKYEKRDDLKVVLSDDGKPILIWKINQ